jgi:protein transport protein SEC31
MVRLFTCRNAVATPLLPFPRHHIRCELRDPAGGSVADVAWNPDQGLHLVTASGDDKNPVIKLWDLRSSTSLPLATLQGHKEGILSVSWCPTDASLLLSCAKDNRTILWDLFQLQPVYDLPSRSTSEEQQTSESEGMFGGLASSASQRRYNVSWSPCLPAVVSASSFDRKIQFFSMVGAKSRIGRAPKWLRRPVGATFGFGGKLVSFDNRNQPAPTGPQGKRAAASTIVRIHQVVEDPELVQASDLFHGIVAKGEYKKFCDLKAVAPDVSPAERQVWSLMNVICFGSNAREELLTHLGFDSASITETAQAYVGKNHPLPSRGSDTTPNPGLDVDSLTLNDGMSILAADDMFSSPPPPSPPVAAPPVPKAQPRLPEDIAKTAELWEMIQSGNAAEPTIRRAIIVGNFEAAVECCLEAGLMAEALLLAQCGDQALRVRTQAAFFEKRRHEHPFLNVLHAVIRNELMNYVVASDLTRWKETLALLSTYGKSDEFPALCEALAGRLENELRDTSSATLCYMCAANVVRVVEFWTAELNAANEALGRVDTHALENYVEKVVVFTHANPTESLGRECSAYFSKYAELLAGQGRLTVALSYLKGQNLAENVLIDRLYHAGEKPAGSRPPAFPFPKTQVEAQPQSQASPAVSQGTSGKGTNPQQPASAATKGVSPNTSAAALGIAGTQKAGQAGTGNRASVNPHAATASFNAHPAAAAHTPAPAATSAYVLPEGWLQLVDPTSNRPYYVYTPTGVSQWDPPASAAVAPTPAPTPAPAPAQTVASPMTANKFPSAGDNRSAAMGAGGPATASSNPMVSTFTPNAAAKSTGQMQTSAAANPSTPAAATPTQASAPAVPAVNLADTPEGQYVQYLGQIISNLSSKFSAPLHGSAYAHVYA